jgi:hypothetical protein
MLKGACFPMEQLCRRIEERKQYLIPKPLEKDLLISQNSTGQITKIATPDYELQAHHPNCYYLINEKVFKISDIIKTNDVKIEGAFIQNLVSFYNYPIDSSRLDIYSTDSEELSETFQFDISDIQKKSCYLILQTFFYTCLLFILS